MTTTCPNSAQCDWVIEAVAENLAIKTALLARVVPHLAPAAVLTTNTSGLPIAQIAAGLSSHRERFFGTHFFNPPRYMRLLEVIPTAETDPAVWRRPLRRSPTASWASRWCIAHDTPNFIANRIGVAVTFTAATLMLEQGLTIEEVDALTGQAIGWPRTGTFRLADLVGIDILAHVAANFPQGVPPGKFSGVLEEIVRRGWLGDKAGQGFYKKTRGADRRRMSGMVLDLATFEYRPSQKPALPALEMAKNAATLHGAAAGCCWQDDPKKDKAATFLWPFLSSLWNFAADRIGEAADDAPSIDRAMRAGFNWELGPFEMWDAAGCRLDRRTDEGPGPAGEPARGSAARRRPEFLVFSGRPAVLSAGDGQAWSRYRRIPGHARVADFRRSNGVVRGNAGASLVDLGDGIGCIELHSLKNAIGGDVVATDRRRCSSRILKRCAILPVL